MAAQKRVQRLFEVQRKKNIIIFLDYYFGVLRRLKLSSLVSASSERVLKRSICFVFGSFWAVDQWAGRVEWWMGYAGQWAASISPAYANAFLFRSMVFMLFSISLSRSPFVLSVLNWIRFLFFFAFWTCVTRRWYFRQLVYLIIKIQILCFARGPFLFDILISETDLKQSEWKRVRYKRDGSS